MTLPDAGSVTRLTLTHPSGVSAIDVGQGALAGASGDLQRWMEGRTVFLVSSAPVLELHGATLDEVSTAARNWVVLQVEDGEAAKRVSVVEDLWKRMLGAGGKRDSRLIAFGGGSIGDLGGFAAGCFLRGIEVTQLPTTLLGQVDAALGGKTAVDLPGAKNSVGLFHHPTRVISDTSFLTTLPSAELRSGLMEVVKMAMLLDERLLSAVEEGLEELLGGDASALAPVVTEASRAKIGVVERDPAEGGERRLLNFGHTLGHAIESALGYRELRHGEAVGYGMLFALRLAAHRGLQQTAAARLKRLLGRVGLPPLPPLGVEDLISHMARDKKASERGLVWVLPAAVGRGEMVSGIPLPTVETELLGFLADPWA